MKFIEKLTSSRLNSYRCWLVIHNRSICPKFYRLFHFFLQRILPLRQVDSPPQFCFFALIVVGSSWYSSLSSPLEMTNPLITMVLPFAVTLQFFSFLQVIRF